MAVFGRKPPFAANSVWHRLLLYFFGPVCVISTSLIQSMHEASQPLNWYDITPALYMSLAIGLMCINSTMLYGYASYYRDLRNSKASFVTLCGRRITRIIFIVNGALYTAIIIGMCYSLHLNIYSLEMTPSVLCFIIDIYIWWKMRTPRDIKTTRSSTWGTSTCSLWGCFHSLSLKSRECLTTAA